MRILWELKVEKHSLMQLRKIDHSLISISVIKTIFLFPTTNNTFLIVWLNLFITIVPITSPLFLQNINLSSLSNLIMVLVGHNSIGVEGAKVFAAAIKENISLTHLILGNQHCFLCLFLQIILLLVIYHNYYYGYIIIYDPQWIIIIYTTRLKTCL